MLTCSKCYGTFVRDSASLRAGQIVICETCHLPFRMSNERGRYGYFAVPYTLTEEAKKAWDKQTLKDEQIKALEQVIDSIRRQPIC